MLRHAIANIELNAVDLALDMASRFTKTQLPVNFYHDWLGVDDYEARHFLMLRNQPAGLGAAYGDLPAHDGRRMPPNMIFWRGWQLHHLCLKRAGLM